MEVSLFERLPSGGAWWNVLHPAADKWSQGPYEQAHRPTIAPRSNPMQPAHAGEPQPKKDVCRGFTQEVANKPAAPPRGGVRAFQAVLEALDPCSSLYTKDQAADAMNTVRERLLGFVTGLAHSYFGPKKARVLSLWLSNNRIKGEDAPILEEFLGFLLEDKAVGWTLAPGPRGEWFVTKN